MIALPFGFLAGARAGKWGDRVILFLSQIGIALPNFWFALLLILSLLFNLAGYQQADLVAGIKAYGKAWLN